MHHLLVIIMPYHYAQHKMRPIVPSTQCMTMGDHAFPVAATREWNDLPPTIRAPPSLLMFHQQLKTFLFQSKFYRINNDGFQ